MKIVVAGNIGQSLVNFRGPLLRSMVELGHDVVTVAPDGDTAYAQEVEALGVRYRTVPLQRAGVGLVADLRTLLGFWRLLGEERPDVFLGYTIKPVIYGNLAAQLRGVPVRSALITGLGYAFGERRGLQRTVGWLVDTLYRLALGRARVVFFQNPDDRAEFLRRGFVDEARAALVAGSGVDLTRFVSSPPPPGPPVFLLIARLIREKGIDQYVAAARAIKARHPEARFQLLGPLDQNPSAVAPAEVEAWQREEVVEYLGETSDVRPYLERASVFVLPSYYREGTPRTALEALATGRPVVTTDAPGCRETVVDGVNGFLVEPRSAAALEAALERFVREPELIARMGAASLELARTKYDVRLVNRAMLAHLGLDRRTVPALGSGSFT